MVDDEPFAMDLIKDYIMRTPFLEFLQSFSNPFKALDYLNRERVDLVFLDINMPELSGIQLINTMQRAPMVIFTTAYSHYAVESYEYNAVDYLLKPVKYERFLKAVSKASSLMGSNSTTFEKEVLKGEAIDSSPIFIKSGFQLVKLDPKDIFYIEAAGNYMCFHTKEQRIMSLLTMKDVLELLPTKNFLRVHKSYIISLNHIEAIERSDVIVNGKQIPIGITYREKFLSLYAGSV